MRVARTMLFVVGLCFSLFLSQPRRASAQGTPDWPTGGTTAQPAGQEPSRPATNTPGTPWVAVFISDLRSGFLVPTWISPTPRRLVGDASLARPMRRRIGR